jgi:hypothetical protein
MGVEIKKEIEQEGFCEDMEINNPCLLKNPDYLLFSVVSVPIMFVEFPKSFVNSSVVITTTRDCFSFKSWSLDHKKPFLEYRLIPKSFLIVKLSFLKETCC